MGTFRVTIEIGDPVGQRYEPVEAVVDTGATYTTVPAAVLERLGVVPHVRDRFVLADGRREDRDIGRTWVRVNGRVELTLVVFGGAGAPALLGAYTLEGLRLAADPVGRQLIPVPGPLLRREVRMLRRHIADRQAQWARCEAWEENWNKGQSQRDAEEAVRAVGEVVEFYLAVSGGLGSARSVTEKAEAIRRLQHTLRFVPRAE